MDWDLLERRASEDDGTMMETEEGGETTKEIGEDVETMMEIEGGGEMMIETKGENGIDCGLTLGHALHQGLAQEPSPHAHLHPNALRAHHQQVHRHLHLQ